MWLSLLPTVLKTGAQIFANKQKAKILNHGEKCLVILPDSIRKYLSKFVDDNWM